MPDGGDIYRGSAGEQWWHIFHADYSELRAAGFSPSGRSLVVATSSDITLWTRTTPDDPGPGHARNRLSTPTADVRACQA